MRISDQQITALTQYDMNAAYEGMARAQTVLSTGRQINTPADNPIGAAVALDLQGQIAQSTEFDTTASDSLGWMQATDTSLSGVNDVVLQVRALAVQGANDTLTSDERQGLAANVAQLIQQAVQSANGTYGNRYVLSGYQTATAPFAVTSSGGTSSVTYQGDSGAIQREVSAGQTMQINVAGNTALPAVFQALSQIQADLQSNNSAALGGADLQGLDTAHDGLLVTQATVGANINRIQAVQQTLQTTELNLNTHLSQTVDADMAAAAVDFSSRQATYQAALSAAAKVIQPTLLEFLK